jgi:hypothetical protein
MTEPQPPKSTSRWPLIIVGCLGLLALLTATGAVVIAFVLPGILRRAQPPNPSRMAIVLEKIADDQETFRAGDQEHDGVQDYGTLAELVAADLLVAAYETGENFGYRFEVRVSAAEPTAKWMAVANPHDPSAPDAPAFVINHERVLHTVPGTAAFTPDCALPADAAPYSR